MITQIGWKETLLKKKTGNPNKKDRNLWAVLILCGLLNPDMNKWLIISDENGPPVLDKWDFFTMYHYYIFLNHYL